MSISEEATEFPRSGFSLFSGPGGVPLKLEVVLTSSDEVLALRQQVRDLTSQLQQMQQRVNRAEYAYGWECTLNDRLLDFCRVNGLKVPHSLLERPF